MHLVSVGLSADEVRDFYEGFCNATLWPLYHDVIAPPEFHRQWWDAYVRVNQRFAEAAAAQAAPGATVWVHDYQLQLVPGMLRELRSDVRIGFFTHIPFPGYEIFAQLPWRRQIVAGPARRRPARASSARATPPTSCAPAAGRRAGHARVARPGPGLARRPATASRRRRQRVARTPGAAASAPPPSRSRSTPPASSEIARRPDVQARAREIREALGKPTSCCSASTGSTTPRASCTDCRPTARCSNEGRLGPPEAVLVQVASPSRERVEHYRRLRDEVEVTVGRINGEHGEVGNPPVHYLHQSYPREEMAALYLAADVMLVTPLRDGMNLVAKEYVACRYDETGALVLSEFTGAADELAARSSSTRTTSRA